MSEQKTAKIKEIGAFRKWDGPHGTVYFYPIVMENGDDGDIGVKSAGSLNIGDEFTYTIETNEHGCRIKKVQTNNFGGGGFGKAGSRGSTASFALSYAKDIAVANINKSTEPLPMDGLADKIITTAEKFQKWLKENE